MALLLPILSIASAWADEMSEDMAKAYAQRFAFTHVIGGFDIDQLKPMGQVCGLYVFSMSDEGGFIIVSSDDSTIPILGFSENGKLDLENIPDNMRAWLQGYADEIAWLQQHDYGWNESRNTAPTRSGMHEKETIAPLVTARWSQRTPYNDMCPDYSAGKRSVTGCVATAMAQVMDYHKWPTATTEAIPGYKDGYGVNHDPLEATTFDWDLMANSYSGGETSEQNAAVAELMQYCGYSVEMNYGPSSGASIFKVAHALKDYFDYNSTTTYIARSFYSNDKWEDIIYHELASNRPVLYGGQSTGGGHAFVCDGYQYANGTDFFHINWGWGGQSDEYYVLSVLDPYSGQGVGGSSSKGGFYFGQEAVIGIQKPSDEGVIADITPAIVDLTPNSMTLSENPIIIGETVDITLNITNSSPDDFDGDLYIGTMGSLLVGNHFSIPAGQTQDCVFSYKPTMLGTYNLVFYEPREDGYLGMKGSTLETLNVVEETPPTPIEPQYLAPENLTVSDITTTTALISWEGSATSYDVRYGFIPESSNDTQEWLKYDEDNIKNIATYGFSLPETTWGVMYPGSMVTGNRLSKVSFYETPLNTENFIVNIYVGGDNAPETLLHTETVTPSGKYGFHEVTLPTPITMTPGENLWITLTEKGQNPIACYQVATVIPNNQWLFFNDKWYKVDELLTGFDYGWRIRGLMETGNAVEWFSTVNSTETSFMLTDLNPATEYVVQVRGDYGDENYSEWVTTNFTTNEETALNSAVADSEDDCVWYSLDGHRLSSKPTAKGIYIRYSQGKNNGRKVVMTGSNSEKSK